MIVGVLQEKIPRIIIIILIPSQPVFYVTTE
jgi:hypothetical protein